MKAFNKKNLNLDIKTLNKKNVLLKSTKIMPYFLHKNFYVYNGKIFIKIFITKEMINHKIGEFVLTRKKFSFKKKKK
uniref:Ribosomal protein S19 n=1 Tax=Melosira undulata TaxID=2133757 RepID=A0A3G1PWE7_9STRA|nr:ribosomal protein S19 [Melosira undulata]AVR57560.1 ribosomal protein S19 [Melosira undulata]